MIHFPPLRTRRVSVALKELSLDQAISMCKLPPDRHEAAITQFLRFSAAGAERPRPDYVIDPRLWTVSERLRLVVQYLMGVTDDGPDFSVGRVRMSDYIDFNADPETMVIDGIEIDGVHLQIRPLLGLQAEALEILCSGRGEWMIGCIAAQILPVGEQPSWADMPDVSVLAWHKARMQAVRALPESQFERLVLAFHEHQPSLRQFFNIGVGDEGIVCLPNEPGDEVPPGRFRPSSCISPSTVGLFANPRRG